jgi:hypothetical protein
MIRFLSRAVVQLRRSIAVMAISLCSIWLTDVAVADVVVCPLEEAMKRLEDYNTHLNAEVAQKCNEKRARGWSVPGWGKRAA